MTSTIPPGQERLTISATGSSIQSLRFDFPGLRIGSASYPEGPTGCTVFRFEPRARCAVDVRGGSPGVILLGPWESGECRLDGICLTGGSVYGLEAVSGASSELFREREHRTGWQDLAGIAGAVIYDFRPRDNAIYPDKRLGQYACAHAVSGSFPLGRAGAGSSATVGKAFFPDLMWEHAGQGAAYGSRGEVKVAVFTVVNAVGAIVDRHGNVVRGNLDRSTMDRLHGAEALHRPGSAHRMPAVGNTTLTVVITNQRLAPAPLTQLARQIHGSMSRAIQPFHAPTDGDVLFMASTEAVEDRSLSDAQLGIMASELAWDAVLSSTGTVHETADGA